jgi:hypothetical protein
MLQDALVGRKWEGSDTPTSILEAAELLLERGVYVNAAGAL